eukprot:4130047-Pyramimonas_sp.AAC.1
MRASGPYSSGDQGCAGEMNGGCEAMQLAQTMWVRLVIRHYRQNKEGDVPGICIRGGPTLFDGTSAGRTSLEGARQCDGTSLERDDRWQDELGRSGWRDH